MLVTRPSFIAPAPPLSISMTGGGSKTRARPDRPTDRGHTRRRLLGPGRTLIALCLSECIIHGACVKNSPACQSARGTYFTLALTSLPCIQPKRAVAAGSLKMRVGHIDHCAVGLLRIGLYILNVVRVCENEDTGIFRKSWITFC